MSQPKNWPPALPYLSAPLLHKDLSTAQLQLLKTKPSTASSDASYSSTSVPTVPIAASQSPSPLVRIQPIHDPSHPAHGQYGLFATRDLRPGTFILPYLGRVHPGTGSATDPTSDYDLWLDHGADVAVDAGAQGNEARFVNDYRGVREQGPNAEFGTAWCERWGQLCVGFWVLRAGTGKGKAGKAGKGAKAKGDRSRQDGIRKGEEILVSYGKGFWNQRSAETATEEDALAGDEQNKTV